MAVGHINDPLRNGLIVALPVAWLSLDGAEPAQAANTTDGNEEFCAAIARADPFIEGATFFRIWSHGGLEARSTIFADLT